MSAHSYRVNTKGQHWDSYTPEEHDRWRRLFERQQEVLAHRVCPQFLQGLEELGVMATHIPKFSELNKVLQKKTGWRVSKVKGLVPDDVFYGYLARRIFPATTFIRSEEEFDYIEAPDIFHDVYGHVPMIMDAAFADYLQGYGVNAVKAFKQGHGDYVARLYWFTTEFGLVETANGLRIYGSGICSSPEESVYALESQKPNRVRFNIERVMRIKYEIDHKQDLYFVVSSIKQLMMSTRRDFSAIFANLDAMSEEERNLKPTVILPTDVRW